MFPPLDPLKWVLARNWNVYFKEKEEDYKVFPWFSLRFKAGNRDLPAAFSAFLYQESGYCR
jgi:hypothetical protein